MHALSEPRYEPKTLKKGSEEVRKRRLMLRDDHIVDLTEFAESLRKPGVSVPYFDPMDGGREAKILFLFEKPGPRAGGSGFISRDNDDPTAAATLDFMCQAGIDRKLTVIWNVIPWWNGTIAIGAGQLRAGLESLSVLLTKLSALEVVVLVGRKAERALAQAKGYQVVCSCHPSRRVRARYKDRWEAIPSIWGSALTCLESRTPSSEFVLTRL